MRDAGGHVIMSTGPSPAPRPRPPPAGLSPTSQRLPPGGGGRVDAMTQRRPARPAVRAARAAERDGGDLHHHLSGPRALDATDHRRHLVVPDRTGQDEIEEVLTADTP